MGKGKMVSVNPSRFKYMREYYNISEGEISDSLKIKKELLKAIESGEDYPTYAQLERIAAFYNKPVFFFFDNSVIVPRVEQVVFRSIENKYGEHLTKQTIELIEKASAYKENLQDLFEKDDVTIFAEVIKHCQTDTALIRCLRDILELDLNKQRDFKRTEHFLEYLREKFFEIGVYVFKDSFKNDRIFGLCIYDPVFPVIIINNKTSLNRQVFTLFHEVYHIYCKDADIDYSELTEEAACNTFASDFLIPKDEFINEISNVDDIEDIAEIDRIARSFNVSRDAILYRLVKEGVLTWEFYRGNSIGNFREKNSIGGGNFYYTKMSYLGQSYLKKVFNAYYKGAVTKRQVGIYTGLKSMHVTKLASNMLRGAL